MLHRQAHARQSRAFARGTQKNHLSHVKLFLSFAIFYRLAAFPAALSTLLCFLEYLTRFYASPKAVANVFSSIKLQHERLGLGLALFEHIRLRLALRSLPRTMRVATSPAVAFPATLLRPLVEAAEHLGQWATPFRALVLFAFFTFARLGSLLPVRGGGFDSSRFPTLGDLVRGRGGFALRLKHSKTRQQADGGFLVPLFPARHLPCPVAAALRLRGAARGMGAGPASPLFASRPGGASGVVSLVQPQARGMLGICLAALGLPRTAFSFHSFRRGGCSFAFEQGALESDLALHGDWRSDAIRAYYPAQEARARVARVLAVSSPSLN